MMPTTAAHPDADLRLTVVSATARRMRVHASGFRFDTVRAVAIEDAVGMVTGVEAVRAYPRTASVVIWYTPERCDTASVLSAIADAEHIPVASVPPRTPHSADGRKPGVVQRVIDWSTRVRSGSCDVEQRRPWGTVSDGCCEHDDSEDAPERLWQVVKLRRAALSGVLLTGS